MMSHQATIAARGKCRRPQTDHRRLAAVLRNSGIKSEFRFAAHSRLSAKFSFAPVRLDGPRRSRLSSEAARHPPRTPFQARKRRFRGVLTVALLAGLTWKGI